MGREALPLPWSPLFDGGGVGAEGPPSLQLGEWAGSALVGGGGDVCAAIQSWGATAGREGGRTGRRGWGGGLAHSAEPLWRRLEGGTRRRGRLVGSYVPSCPQSSLGPSRSANPADSRSSLPYSKPWSVILTTRPGLAPRALEVNVSRVPSRREGRVPVEVTILDSQGAGPDLLQPPTGPSSLK